MKEEYWVINRIIVASVIFLLAMVMFQGNQKIIILCWLISLLAIVGYRIQQTLPKVPRLITTDNNSSEFIHGPWVDASSEIKCPRCSQQGIKVKEIYIKCLLPISFVEWPLAPTPLVYQFSCPHCGNAWDKKIKA